MDGKNTDVAFLPQLTASSSGRLSHISTASSHRRAILPPTGDASYTKDQARQEHGTGATASFPMQGLLIRLNTILNAALAQLVARWWLLLLVGWSIIHFTLTFSRRLVNHGGFHTPFHQTSLQYHLERVTSLRPLEDVVVFIRTPGQLMDRKEITACIYFEPSFLADFRSWAENWSGPISAVLVLPAQTDDLTIRRIARQVGSNDALANRVWLHGYKRPHKGSIPHNSLLNLARFFAPSSHVLLMDSIVPLPANTTLPLDTTSVTFLQLDSFEQQVLAFIVDRTFPFWCPERFISGRQNQWSECLKVMSLSSRGSMNTIKIVNGVQGRKLGTEKDSFLDRIDRKLASYYDTEMCLSLARSMVAQGEWWMVSGEERVLTKGAEWINERCSKELSLWGKDLL